MIQFNLLPDVKLDYIKAQRSSRLALSISVLVSAAAVALLLILLSVEGLQNKHLSDLNRDIKSETAKLQNEPQLDKILTVQNQLESLTTLHNQKPAVSRLFTYLTEITPAQVNINSLHIDFTQNAATLTGTADSLTTVNKFVDTLKFTTYAASTGTTSPSSVSNGPSNNTVAFTNVVLSSFGLNSGGQKGNNQASYSISFAFDHNIFDDTQTVQLTVPSEVTTRSDLDKPADLFTAPPVTSTTTGTNNTTSGGSH